MKKRVCTGLISVVLVLSGCNITSSGSSSVSENLAKFTTPGTEVSTMNGEVPFVNFTIDDGAFHTKGNADETRQQETESVVITTEEKTTAAPTEANPDNPSYTVMLDPGHGGIFGGAEYNGYSEKILSLQLAFKIQKYLLTNYEGLAVYLTRTEDKELSADQSEDLNQRTQLAVDAGATVLVSLHFDVDSQTHASSGSRAFVSKQPGIYEPSFNLASCILGNLGVLGIQSVGVRTQDSTTYFDANGVSLDYYAINRLSAEKGLCGIIIEHCFLDNPNEVQFFGTEEALDRLAQADGKGIAEFFGLQPVQQ